MTADRSISAADRIARLVEQIEQQPESPLKDQAREIVASVLELHREGLEQMVAGIQALGIDGRKCLQRLSSDPLVGSLLALHDLGPMPDATMQSDFVDATKLTARVRAPESSG